MISYFIYLAIHEQVVNPFLFISFHPSFHSVIYLFFHQFSCSVMSDSLRPHEPQHARPPCPSPTPRVHPNPCPLSQWCHPTISSSVIPFSSCPQSFPAWGSFKWVSSSHQVAKVLEFQLHLPNIYSLEAKHHSKYSPGDLPNSRMDPRSPAL